VQAGFALFAGAVSTSKTRKAWRAKARALRYETIQKSAGVGLADIFLPIPRPASHIGKSSQRCYNSPVMMHGIILGTQFMPGKESIQFYEPLGFN
jgi:hypothetical protein